MQLVPGSGNKSLSCVYGGCRVTVGLHVSTFSTFPLNSPVGSLLFAYCQFLLFSYCKLSSYLRVIVIFFSFCDPDHRLNAFLSS